MLSKRDYPHMQSAVTCFTADCTDSMPREPASFLRSVPLTTSCFLNVFEPATVLSVLF
jgi:hypothetical protein